MKILNGVNLRKKEKILADVLILLALAFLFISPGLLDLDVFTYVGSSGSAITGMAVSGDYNDTYSVNLPLRSELGREVQLLTENELGGLTGGTIVTSLGTTNYNQYLRFSNFMGSAETLLNSPEIVYTNSDGVGGYLSDWLYIPESTTAGGSVDSFLEWGVEFDSGLKSDVEDNKLVDLTDKIINILSKNYKIFSTNFDFNSKSITLGLLNTSVEDSMDEEDVRTYFINNVDYTLEVLDIPFYVPTSVKFNLSGSLINTGETSYLIIGETHFMSDGTFLFIDDISIDETTLSGFVDGYAENTSLFNSPYDIVMNNDAVAPNSMFVSDRNNNAIRMIDLDNGIVSTIAGGNLGFVDGELDVAQFRSPEGIDISPTGDLYVADYANQRIRKIELDWNGTAYEGNVSTIAGTGVLGFTDNTPGTYATFRYPKDVAVVDDNLLYVADRDNRIIRSVFSNGVTSNVESDEWNVTIYAGTQGSASFSDGELLSAEFSEPSGLDYFNGDIYVADRTNHAIRKINSTHVSTIVGNGTSGYQHGGVSLSDAMLNNPEWLVVDSNGDIYISDRGNQFIRFADISAGNIYPVAGNLNLLSGNLDGTGFEEKINNPRGLVLNSNGDIYFADSSNHKLRKISLFDSSNLGVEILLTYAGGGTAGVNSVSFSVGGDIYELTDTDYTDDDSGTNNGYYSGVEYNADFLSSALVQIILDDSNVTNISVNSIKYRLNVNSIENNGVWTGFNQSVKDFLNESAGMIGDFDIFYEGLDDLSSSEIELKPLDSTNQTYELEFTNYLGDLYSIPYVTNLNDAFKMGDNLTDLVFIEGIFDINANNPLDHSPTIGVGDYFVLNTHASYSGTAISRILKYVSFDSVSNSLLFRDVSTLQDYDITYSTSGLANGTMGFATLTVDNTGHGVYVMNVSTGNAPLVIDLNANSVVNNNERVWITFNGGGVIDPLAVGALAGGVWSSHSSDPNDMYGNWSDNGTTSTANEMSFALVSFFEEFGYNSDIQSGSNDYCAFDDSSLNCTNYALTPGTVAFDITNNAGETFAGLVAEVDGCLASNSNPVTLLDGATGTFNFDSCSGQNMPGIRISKNFSLNRTTGSGCSGSNCIIETYTGSMISLIVGSDPICINEQTDIKIAKVGNNQLTIDGTNTPTCEFSLEQNQTGESFFGMTNYGANYFINLSDPIGSINGETLEIDYPIQQKRGLVIIGTGGDSSSSCSPNCPDPSSVACGDPIIPTNGCGSCGGSGTYCGSGLTCDGNDCVSCTPDCSGKQCGSDGCGGSCGSCGGSDVCSNNLCCTPLNNTQACTDNNYTCGNVDDGCGGNVDCGDCSSGETCSSNVCVDDGGDPHDTYYFNLSNNYEYFDLDEEDEVIVQGLDDDYNVILRTVWSSGRIRLSLPQTSYLWLYIEAVGNTINIDLDEDGITDINVKSIEIDAVDDEAELRFSAGEYTGSNNGGSGGGSGGGTVCGDGNCEGSENTITCPTDCGTSVSTGTGVNVANNQPTNTRSASSTTSTVVKSDSRAVLWLILGILITIIMIMVIYSFVRSGKGSQKKYGQINKNYSEQDKPRVGW